MITGQGEAGASPAWPSPTPPEQGEQDSSGDSGEVPPRVRSLGMVTGQIQGQAGMTDAWVGGCINGVQGWAQAWLQCNSGGRQEPQLKSSSPGKKQGARAEVS